MSFDFKWDNSMHYPPGPGRNEYLGKYQVKNLVCLGMGVIYNAINTETGEEKVLKTIHNLESSFSLNELFDNEIEITQKLNDEGIEGVIDCDKPFEYNGQLYLPLEKLDKKLCGGRGNRKDYFSEGDFFEQLGEYMLFMADVLINLKREGIVHRDIKPGNIMVNKKGKLILFDFGISYDLTKDSKNPSGLEINLDELYKVNPCEAWGEQFGKKTKHGITRGTRGFIAPELFSYVLPMPQSDMYSTGRTILKILLQKCYPKNIEQEYPTPDNKYRRFIQPVKPEYNVIAIKELKKEVNFPTPLEAILFSLLEEDPNYRLKPEELKEATEFYMKNV